MLLCCFTQYGAAQKRDPLNEKEVDQMREAADWPDKRLELMVKFARDRMTAIDQLRAGSSQLSCLNWMDDDQRALVRKKPLI